MFCFENALFESCEPILVVYFVFVFCVILITIVWLRCACSSCQSSQRYDKNYSINDYPSIVYVSSIQDSDALSKIGGDKILEDIKIEKDDKISSDIVLQQMEIYQMAEYNQIKPSHI